MAREDTACDRNNIIKNAFINNKNGSQDFQDATIKSSAVKSSFINREEESQTLIKAAITSPKIESAFLNSGSGHQNFSDSNRSIRAQFKRLQSGISSLFNYDGSKTKKYGDSPEHLPAELTQNIPAKEEGKPVEVAKSSSSIPKFNHKTCTSKPCCEVNFFEKMYFRNSYL